MPTAQPRSSRITPSARRTPRPKDAIAVLREDHQKVSALLH